MLGGAIVWVLLSFLVPVFVPPPAAVGILTSPRPALSMEYLVDDSWLDHSGERQISQQIFDRIFANIGRAEQLVLVDMFLFNDWQGPSPESHRALADELTDALVSRRRSAPDLQVIVVTDPINVVYGGLVSEHLERLRAAGVEVVLTDLVPLQDSNPLWSGLWRWLIRPFGNDTGGILPNPLGPGQVSLRSWLALANFKANHRKLMIADNGQGRLEGLVTSANPHDGSSAHRNTALVFEGLAVDDLLAAERALLVLSGADAVVDRLDEWLDARSVRVDEPGVDIAPDGESGRAASVQVLGESRIEAAALEMLAQAGAGSHVELAMFYLSDRELITALGDAARRGADVRVLLDINRNAFGRAKNGVPNRPVAAELVHAGVQVRWCETAGEQCHAKQLLVESDGRVSLLLGSGNYTRRNLHDRNLETDVRIDMSSEHRLAGEVNNHFDRLWNNRDQRTYSKEYATYADERLWLKIQYRVMEATGLSTF